MKSHSKTDQGRNSLATFMAYLQFCRENPHYAPCFGNQLRIMDWIDERRIEMEAVGLAILDSDRLGFLAGYVRLLG